MAMEVSSTYQSVDSVAEYRGKFDVSGTFNENDVILEPVEEGEYVLGVPRSEHISFYMHTIQYSTKTWYKEFLSFIFIVMHEGTQLSYSLAIQILI
jgi:hypothetical protein